MAEKEFTVTFTVKVTADEDDLGHEVAAGVIRALLKDPEAILCRNDADFYAGDGETNYHLGPSEILDIIRKRK